MVASPTTGTPTGRPAIYGGYAQLKYGNNTKDTLCGVARNGVGGTLGVPVAAGGPGFVGTLGLPGTCSPDFNLGVIGGNIVWTPVKGFAFTVDVNVTFLDQKYDGTFAAGNAAVAKPGGDSTKQRIRLWSTCSSALSATSKISSSDLTEPPAGNCRGFCFA